MLFVLTALLMWAAIYVYLRLTGCVLSRKDKALLNELIGDKRREDKEDHD